MKNLNIKILNKEEFEKMLLEHLVFDKKDWSIEGIFRDLLADGFPKLDWERLNDCLSRLMVYLPTVAVDVNDETFLWVVSGNKAILVKRDESRHKQT